MKFLMSVLLTLLLVVGFNAHSETSAQTKNAAFDLNKASPGAMAKHQLGSRITRGTLQTLIATYDFSVLGGVLSSTVNLLTPSGQTAYLPNNAVILDCTVDVQSNGTTSASGTISLGVNTTTDLKTALIATSYTTSARLACVPVGTAATTLKATADRPVTATIATGAVTGGKFNVIIQYIISE